MMRKLRTSPAKINLFLYVIGRDIRGYHKLQSLFCLIPNLYDSLYFEDSHKLEVVSNIVNNLVTKAAIACGVNDMRITLKKNIPMGAGLGGGSSNAATTLLEIGRRLNITRDDLISKKIGDDVEFFLYEKNSMYFDCDECHEVELGFELEIVLVKPDFSINTKEVYDLLRNEIKSDQLHPVVDITNLKHYIFNGENQLYLFALRVDRRLDIVISILNSCHGIIASRMTGSGSSCFGIFNSSESAIAAVKAIKNLYPIWFIHYCRLQI